MAYAQVAEILDYALKLQKRVASVCNQRSSTIADEQSKALFERLCHHEKNMQAYLKTYTSEATDGVLDTWIQYSGMEEIDAALEEINAARDGPAEVLLERILSADRHLQELYRLVAEQANAPRVNEFFDTLLEMEDLKARAIGDNVSQFEEWRRK